MKNTGTLYLIPTTLGENEPLEVLPMSVKKTIEQVNYYIVENEKSARRFIKKFLQENHSRHFNYIFWIDLQMKLNRNII